MFHPERRWSITKMEQAGKGQVGVEFESETCWQKTAMASYVTMSNGYLYFEEHCWKYKFGRH